MYVAVNAAPVVAVVPASQYTAVVAPFVIRVVASS